MAASAKVFFKVEALVDGRSYRMGSDNPVSLTLTSPGGASQDIWNVANGATKTVWDASADPAATFKLIVLVSSQTVMMEFQGSTVANNHHMTLFANLPFILGSDDTLAYNAASFTGAAQDFTKVLIKNSSGSAAFVQRLVAA